MPKKGVDTKKIKKNEPNSRLRLDFFSKPEKRRVGRIWTPYEPCPAKIEDPRGVLPPHIVKKCFFGDIKMGFLLPNFT